MKIKIGNKYIGSNEDLYFIADIGSNHEGNLNRAYKLIELAKEAGADAAKFQNFSASKIVSKRGFESLNTKMSHQKNWTKSVYEIYEDASTSLEWTAKLKKKCEEVNIEYMTSPYDIETVDAVDQYVNAYKIGSGDITWLEIIAHIAKKNKPVILATGASTNEDVERAMATVSQYTKEVVLMQCNTNYTASPDNLKYINLNVLKRFAQDYPNVILGLSDHTHGHHTVLGAIALGATVFEKHFTDDNNRSGPDHKFAMNPKTWSEMVNISKELYLAMGDGKKRIEDNEKETAIVQRRSLRFTKDLSKGHVLQKEDLFPLRPIPSDGIPPYEMEKLIGKKLKNNVTENNHIKWEDIEK